MGAILLVTMLSGILFAKFLLTMSLTDFRFRYPIAVLFSYLVFFACIKLWLSLIASKHHVKDSNGDWLDIPGTSVEFGAHNAAPAVRAGGGLFSGAGASASFDGPETVSLETAAVSVLPSHSGDASDTIGEAAGKAAGALGDDNILVAVIVLLALVATILISAFLLLYAAPTILAEAAFQGVLAASLVKRTRVISDKDWAGSILKSTWKPFAGTLIAAIAAGVVLHRLFPEARRLADVLWR